MDLELISFALCPFVQRGVITLRHKQASFRTTYIDLADPPDWFKAISPFGKVPLLRVDGQHVLFESAVIDEFLDDVTPGRLLPEDPLVRALDRSWIEFASACLLDLSGMMHAKEAESFERNRTELLSRLDWLEKTLRHAPYFNGRDVSLVDFSYAPLFMRAELLGLGTELYSEAMRPRTAEWSRALLALPAVKESAVEDFEERLRGHIRAKAPYAAQQFGLA